VDWLFVVEVGKIEALLMTSGESGVYRAKKDIDVVAHFEKVTTHRQQASPSMHSNYFRTAGGGGNEME
jgi:hypothetical protein